MIPALVNNFFWKSEKWLLKEGVCYLEVTVSGNYQYVVHRFCNAFSEFTVINWTAGPKHTQRQIILLLKK